MELFGHPWWLLFLALVGVVAVVSAVLTLFLALGRPGTFTISERPEIPSGDFLRAVSASVNAPLVSGGSARLLNNGVEIFPAMLSAIAKAERSVNFMVYIWEPGKAADRVYAALLERARAGVQVRLMLDGFGGREFPDERRDELTRAGGRVKWFHPLHFGKLTRYYKRNHRRAIVIDGRVAFTGGAAVGDKWLGDAQDEEHWRDIMVEVRGRIASNLQSAFTQLWANTTGEILVGEPFFPDIEETRDPAGELAYHVNVISSPADSWHPLRVFFMVTLACARKRIWLTNPYFAPDADTRRILADRARQGVDVRLLLPNRLTDAPPVRWAGQAYYADLLKAGVRIHEYQPTMLHSKTLVVDGCWSVVGSANMDVRSKELNQESVIGIMDRVFARQLESTFEADLEDADEILPERWRKRALWRRARERFWVTFAEQM
jgi:cardiolipin synthase A/B